MRHGGHHGQDVTLRFSKQRLLDAQLVSDKSQPGSHPGHGLRIVPMHPYNPTLLDLEAASGTGAITTSKPATVSAR